MTPQEERNKRFDEKLEAGEFDYYEDGKFCGVLKEPLKYHITSEVNLTIEEVEKWAEHKFTTDNSIFETKTISDLLSFLTTLKK